MKKIMVFVIAALISIVFGKMAMAADWEKEASEEPNGHKYVSYQMELGTLACMIVLGDDGFAAVGARDRNKNYTLSQTAVLSPEGKIVSNKKVVGIFYLDDDGATRKYEKDSDLPVFTDKCLPFTKSLPKEVRDKFNGAFGIE